MDRIFPNISDIKRLRESLGISRRELARLSGIDQSVITEIEEGRIKPSYDNVTRIFTVLERKRRERVTKARDIMNRVVVGIGANQKVRDAIEIMEKDRFSQLPVFDRGNVVGSISDQTILNRISEYKSKVPLSELPIYKIMDKPFPTIDGDAPLTLIYELLKHSSAVLIVEKEKIVGIITKTDLFKIV
ncbi:MAG: XRE family transcriptional regulator [Candidatus Altiarchaeales archaeon]|nr:MAG: XRE family transcriptional regulator [Candidatus Altiarchaeales archaeon]RLI95615.1 MAG: XRE family transcriptional regulator [Candidatus Altiarchaeales archaeon]HDO82758.1 CBS domain-containing protein [Candidatus Altiarchaeales archaeon]HEX55407.1 CBS domain-containing protein [Candidatus Altiarchaeales archaeon]